MDDLEGWQQTRWGMNTGEIIEVIGADNLRRYEKTQETERFYQDLKIENVLIGQYNFDVVFQMSKETHDLAQVMVSYNEDPDTNPAGVLKAALKLLTEKFGRPERVGTSDSFEWRFPTTTIEASTLFIEGIASSVFIRFYPSEKSAPVKQMSAF